MTIQPIFKLSLVMLLLTISACSNVTTRPLQPTVELVSVKPLNMSVSEQKLRFALNIINPNNFSLPIEAVDFIARFNDADIASGKSQQGALIPAKGEGILTLDVTAGIDRLMTTLETLLKGEQLNMDYELAGTVKIENWSTPVPFDVSGAMDIGASAIGS